MEREFVFNDELLEQFIYGFYGYGSFKSPIWFIGMEEGLSGSNVDDKRNCINKRLNAWDERGKKVLEDLYEYHEKIGITKFFKEVPPTQTTWREMIRFYLSYHQEKAHEIELVRIYQRDKLGRINFAETTLIELMPLPSTSIRQKDWAIYSGASKIPFLCSRKDYWNKVSEERALKLAEKIDKYYPKIVLFYSLSKKYQKLWEKIADCEFQEAILDGEKHGYRFGENKKTNFLVTPHPAARGVSKDYFIKLGEKMRWKNIRQRKV